MKTTKPNKNKARIITVRSMRPDSADRRGYRVEWFEDARSWKAAWAIVDSAFARREDCKAYCAGGAFDDCWFLDIGGAL